MAQPGREASPYAHTIVSSGRTVAIATRFAILCTFPLAMKACIGFFFLIRELCIGFSAGRHWLSLGDGDSRGARLKCRLARAGGDWLSLRIATIESVRARV